MCAPVRYQNTPCYMLLALDMVLARVILLTCVELLAHVIVWACVILLVHVMV